MSPYINDHFVEKQNLALRIDFQNSVWGRPPGAYGIGSQGHFRPDPLSRRVEIALPNEASQCRLGTRVSVQSERMTSKMYSRLGPVLYSTATLIFFVFFVAWPNRIFGQEYSVRAIDAGNGKRLKGIPITLRYACTSTGSGEKTKIRCKFIQRKTGNDGVAHFPEAGTLKDIDDIYSLPIKYGAICCDISNPVIPGTGTIKFRRRSFGEMLHWIFVGD